MKISITHLYPWRLTAAQGGRLLSLLGLFGRSLATGNTGQASRTDELIRESEEKYRTLIEEASDAIFIGDSEGLILESNLSAWKLSGFDKDELTSMNIRQLYSPEEIRQRPLRIRELLEEKVVRSERTIIRKDGSGVPVEATVKRLSDGRFMAILRDNSERKLAEDKLRAAVEKYELAAQATSDTIWDWDIVRNTKTYNAGIKEVFGYDVHEIQDASQWIIDKIHPEDLQHVEESFQHVVDNMTQNLQLEYRFRCADGSYRHVFDRSFVIYGSDHKPARLIGAMQDVTQKKEEEKRIASAILVAQENERQHLSGELHDNVNQILACAHLFLDATDQYDSEPDKIGELIAGAKENIEMAINEIRKLSHHLSPAATEDTCLKDIIEELLARINVREEFTIRFEFDNELLNIKDDNVVINLYRIIQEQLKNIVKYADARRISVVLCSRQNTISLKIEDDGRGFDPRTTFRGIGLSNIKKRIESLSGKFTLQSAPGKGCTIMAELPMENQCPQ
ncbi:MAG: PAS domain S-box protein [Bacteroidetes bacterium]|nr:PAS domain S-box protein [Bacteroidota bacterium]